MIKFYVSYQNASGINKAFDLESVNMSLALASAKSILSNDLPRESDIVNVVVTNSSNGESIEFNPAPHKSRLGVMLFDDESIEDDLMDDDID